MYLNAISEHKPSIPYVKSATQYVGDGCDCGSGSGHGCSHIVTLTLTEIPDPVAYWSVEYKNMPYLYEIFNPEHNIEMSNDDAHIDILENHIVIQSNVEIDISDNWSELSMRNL